MTILAGPIQHPLPYSLLIFDADGTLRRCTVPGQPCPHRPGEWELLPRVQMTLASYSDFHGKYYGALVSNQGGVEFGSLTWRTAYELLRDCMCAAFPPSLAQYAMITFCPHMPVSGCACRKPSPLLLLKAVYDRRCTLAGSLYVGDLYTDREAAERAGIAFCWAKDFFGWESTP